MRICRACHGYRKDDGTPVMPHVEQCLGSVAPWNIGSPRCECTCTAMADKQSHEDTYRYQTWLELTEPHDMVDAVRPDFPLEGEVHVSFTRDALNTHTERLTRNGAELLYRRLADVLGVHDGG